MIPQENVLVFPDHYEGYYHEDFHYEDFYQNIVQILL